MFKEHVASSIEEYEEALDKLCRRGESIGIANWFDIPSLDFFSLSYH